MSDIRSHRDLIVWQKGMALAVEAYRLAALLPPEERYGVASQITRAAVSVPANIAEGHGRAGTKEYANFLSIARGSLSGLDTLLDLARRVGHLSEKDAEVARSLMDETGRMLTTLIQRLRTLSARG